MDDGGKATAGLRINGHVIPWSVVLFVGTVIVALGVGHYRLELIQNTQYEHIRSEGHSQAIGRVIALEAKIDALYRAGRDEERMLDQYGDRLKNLSSRMRVLEDRVLAYPNGPDNETRTY